MSSSSPIGGGTSQSMWANQPSTPRTGWGRDGEPGSAFRGIGRGRPGGRVAPRGGYGRGRGGSGFRGGPSNRGEDVEKKTNSENSHSKSLLNTAKPAVPPSTGASASGGAKPSSRPRPTRKSSDQKSSRKVSTVHIDSALPSNNTHPSLPARPAPRRRRSQTPSHSNAPTNIPPSVESNVTTAVPTQPPVTKDLPPHLAIAPTTPSFDIKHDIDALVERVRAVAMDRPTTPATHIDWARDEDEDSLPDLDDWGITSSTSATEPRTASLKDSTISPILEGTLKSLPTLDPGPPSIDVQTITEADERPVPLAESAVVQPVSEDVKQGETPVVPEVTPRNDRPKGRRGSRAKNGREVRSNSNTSDMKVGNSKEDAGKATRASVSPSQQRSSEKMASPKTSLKVPLHPSLPPKPEAPLGISSKRYSRNSVLEDASSILPPKPVTPEKSASEEKPTLPEKPVLAEQSMTSEDTPNGPVEQESSGEKLPADTQPTDAEPVAEDAQKQDAPVEQDLLASIHVPVVKAASANQTSSSPNSSAFNPSHGRSHTVGRPPGHPHPRGAIAGISDSHSDSGQGVRSSAAQHLRTQSTPPTTGGTYPRVHHSRPIITGDAISRLARTLGGTLPRREMAGVSAAKD